MGMMLGKTPTTTPRVTLVGELANEAPPDLLQLHTPQTTLVTTAI